jgi:hypothetical protein
MKEFNLQAALAGKPVITRDGRPVEILWYSEERNLLVGLVGGFAYVWTGGGKSTLYTDHDLFMAPSERKEWVVRTGKAKIYGPYDTEDHAIKIQRCEGGTIHEITIHE